MTTRLQLGDYFMLGVAGLQACAVLAYLWKRQYLTATVFACYTVATLCLVLLAMRGRTEPGARQAQDHDVHHHGAFPFPCGYCPGTIESAFDYEWHGLGNCVPICDECGGSGAGKGALV